MERQIEIIRKMAERVPHSVDGFESFSEGSTWNDGGSYYSCVFRCKPRQGEVWFYRVSIPSDYHMDVMEVERVRKRHFNHTVFEDA